MSGTKLLFIFLILILIAFIAIEVFGVRKNSVNPPTVSDGDDGPQVSCDDYPALCSMNTIMEPFSPKLTLTEKTFALTKASPELQIAVPPDEENSFRKAAFKFQQGSFCATVRYTSNGGKVSKLNDQTWPTKKDGVKGTLVIVKSGGKLDVKLVGSEPCVVALQ